MRTTGWATEEIAVSGEACSQKVALEWEILAGILEQEKDISGKLGELGKNISSLVNGIVPMLISLL